MDRVVAEIIMGALAVSLLFCVIPLYRSNQELVYQAVSKEDYSEKVKEVIRPKVSDQTTVSGGEVIAVIRYYALRGDVSITVAQKGGTHEYMGEPYQEEVYTIARNEVFQTVCTYREGRLEAIRYVTCTA